MAGAGTAASRASSARRIRCAARQGAARTSSSATSGRIPRIRRPTTGPRAARRDASADGTAPMVRDQFACNELYKQRGVSCARVAQCRRAPRASDRQGGAAQRALRQHAGGSGRGRRRHRRRDASGGRVDPQAEAAPAAGDPAVQRRRGAGAGRRASVSRRSAEPQRRQPDQPRGARGARAGQHVRDQPSERRADRRLCRFREAPVRQFAFDRRLSPAAQLHRREQLLGARLADAQPRADRQRDALPQPRRRRGGARSGDAPTHGRPDARARPRHCKRPRPRAAARPSSWTSPASC